MPNNLIGQQEVLETLCMQHLVVVAKSRYPAFITRDLSVAAAHFTFKATGCKTTLCLGSHLFRFPNEPFIA